MSGCSTVWYSHYVVESKVLERSDIASSASAPVCSSLIVRVVEAARSGNIRRIGVLDRKVKGELLGRVEEYRIAVRRARNSSGCRRGTNGRRSVRARYDGRAVSGSELERGVSALRTTEDDLAADLVPADDETLNRSYYQVLPSRGLTIERNLEEAR